jgi:Ca-activated chloride channel family protein
VKLVLLVVVLAIASPTGGARAQNDDLRVSMTQIDGSRFPLVTIYISVTDKNGKPAVGLTQDELSLTEDGKPVEIVEFTGSGGAPVNTLLILDRSNSMQGQKLIGAQHAARTFVDQMRPQDQVGLLLFAGAVETAQPLTSDTSALRRSIDSIRLADDTALYDAVIAGLDQLRPISGRKSAIVLSDGMDNRDSWIAQLGGYGSKHTLEESAGQAGASGVTLYTIGLGQRDELNEPALRQLATDAGGAYYHTPSADQLAALYRSLSQQFQTEYAITYRSPRAAYDGTRRGIQVIVNAGGGKQSGSSSGAYLERHLLQLRSTPLAGLALLGLLLIALTLPLTSRLRRVSAAPAPAALPLATGEISPRLDTREPPAAPATPGRTCRACGAALRPTARFCLVCGQLQE